MRETQEAGKEILVRRSRKRSKAAVSPRQNIFVNIFHCSIRCVSEGAGREWRGGCHKTGDEGVNVRVEGVYGRLRYYGRAWVGKPAEVSVWADPGKQVL